MSAVYSTGRVFLGLVAGVCLISRIVGEAVYLFAQSSDLIITVDNRDFLSHRLESLFRLPPGVSAESVSLQFSLESGEWLTYPDCPRVRRSVQQTFSSGSEISRGLENTSFVDIDGFGDWMERHPELKGVFVSYCLFAYTGNLTGMQLSPGRGEACLEVSFKVLDLSLPLKQLSHRVPNESLSIYTGADSSAIAFESLTQGMLPNFLHYSLECEKQTGSQQDSDVQSADDPELYPRLVPNPDSLKREPLSKGSWKGFVGTHRTFLDGIIFDYSPSKGYFKLLNSSTSHETITGVQAHQKHCERAAFFTAHTIYRNYFIVCENSENVEVIQIRLMEVLGKKVNDLQFSVQYSSHVERAVLEGGYRNCSYLPRDESVVCLQTRNQSVGSTETHSQNGIGWGAFNLTMDPLILIPESSITASQLLEIYSKDMKRNSSELSLEILPAYSSFELLFIVSNKVDNDTNLVRLSSPHLWVNWVITDEEFTQPYDFHQLLKLDSTNYTKLETCLTLGGIFVIDRISKSVSFLVGQERPWRQFIKDLSAYSLDKMMFTCYPEDSVLLLELAIDEQLFEVVMLDERLLYDSNLRQKVSVRQLFQTTSYLAPYRFSFYDRNAKKLVWYGLEGLVVPFRYQVNFQETHYWLTTNTTGDFNCKLTGWGILSPSSDNFSLTLHVKIPERLGFKIVAKPKKIPVLSPKDRFVQFNYTIPVEDYISIEGPLLNQRLVQNLNINWTSQQYKLKPRARPSKYSIMVNESHSNYHRMVWVNNKLLFACRGKHIDVLKREPNSREFFVSHELNYSNFSTMYFGAPTTKFDVFEDLKYGFDNEESPSILYLVGLTNPLDPILTSKIGIVRTRHFVIIAVDLKTTQVVCAMLMSWDFKQLSFEDKPWHIAKVLKRSQRGNWLSVRFFDENAYEAGAAVVWELKVTHDILGQQFLHPFYEGYNIRWPQGETISSIIYYWNKDEATDRTIFVQTSQGNVMFYESGSDGVESEIKMMQILPRSLFQGIPVALNCSMVWKTCVFAIDSSFLLQLPFLYSEITHTWRISVNPSDQPIRHPLPTAHRVKRILFFRHHMLLHTDQPASGIYVYRFPVLAYPYCLLPEPYGSQLSVLGVADCDDPSSPDCANAPELLLHPQLQSVPLLYETGPMSLELVNMSAAVLNSTNRFELKFNEPTPVSEPAHRQFARNWTLEVHVAPRGDFSESQSSARHSLTIVAVIILIGAVALFMNFLRYRLITNDQFQTIDQGTLVFVDGKTGQPGTTEPESNQDSRSHQMISVLSR